MFTIFAAYFPNPGTNSQRVRLPVESLPEFVLLPPPPTTTTMSSPSSSVSSSSMKFVYGAFDAELRDRIHISSEYTTE